MEGKRMNFAERKINELFDAIPYSIETDPCRAKGYSVFLLPYTHNRWMMVDKAEDHLFIVIDIKRNDLDIDMLSGLINVPVKSRGKTCLAFNKNKDHIKIRIYENDDIVDFSNPKFQEFLAIVRRSFEKRE
jgi:hypothetical protein